ncbi:MAG: hypothetical protein MUC38_09620 [Cyclobacteriaceae bacterium]|nr:hypothetical protein [Cyclobacteriaceae bacterium]
MAIKHSLLLSTAILGIFLGTQLAEAMLIVPYWKGISVEEFFVFYNLYGKALHQFYSPLTIAATILPVFTFVWSLFKKQKIDPLLWIMVVFTLLFFSSYFVYFKEANLSFANRTIANELLPDKLNEWANWHWGRVTCEAIAFVCGLFLLTKVK